MKCDVLVLGGGSAGLAAAVRAAREGAHTVLVERNAMLGGTSAASLVHSICGLYVLREEPGAVYANPGFPREFAERLIVAGAATGPVRMGRLDVLPHSPPGFAHVAAEVAAECSNLRVLLRTEWIGADAIEPKVIVDTSGDGVLGLESDMTPAGRLQRPAFIFALDSVEPLRDGGRIALAHQIARAVRAGDLPAGVLGAHFREVHQQVYVTIDLEGGPEYDPTDAAQIIGLEKVGRDLARELTSYLRQHHEAFQKAQLASAPTRLGVRESRRLRGRAVITQDDVLRGTEHPDVVALGAWPIELREKATGPRWRFPDANRPTHIPLGALRARGADNVWFAGRCLSCDHEAQAALRVIGTCLATGEAAGLAAALQAARGTCPSAQEVQGKLTRTAL